MADRLCDSSSHVYNAQWKAFAKWANDKGIPSKDLSYITLAEYRVHLYVENKQVNTIKVHRAAIASVLKMLNPPTVLQEETIHNHSPNDFQTPNTESSSTMAPQCCP